MKKLFVAAAVVTTAALALTGCSGTGGNLEAVPGFDPATKTITVGSLVPVSGVFAGAITNIQGQQAYFNRATAKGGPLEGYTIKLVNQDTKYDAAVALPLYNSTKSSVVMWSEILGSAITDALLPSMRDSDEVGLPAGVLTDQRTDPNLVPTFPDLNNYHAATVQYAAEEKGQKAGTFCSLATEDVYGKASVASFNAATKTLGLKVGIQKTFAPTTDMTAEVTALKAAGCTVVDVAAIGPFLQGYAVKAVQLDFNALAITTNVAYSITMASGPGSEWLAKNALFAVTGTQWDGTQNKGQMMMQEDLNALGEKIVPTANAYQTGYVNAMVTVAILAKAIKSGSLSHKSVLAASQSLGTFDDLGLQGGPYQYGNSPKERVAPSGMSIFSIDASVPAGLKLVKYNYESSVLKTLDGKL
jgi:ABC-type branched-subunit amino acid transport system substrate-binding protein